MKLKHGSHFSEHRAPYRRSVKRKKGKKKHRVTLFNVFLHDDIQDQCLFLIVFLQSETCNTAFWGFFWIRKGVLYLRDFGNDYNEFFCGFFFSINVHCGVPNDRFADHYVSADAF